MGFVPMHLCRPDATVFQPHSSYAFELPPPAWTILFSKTHNIPDATPDSDGFDMLYCSYDLEIHRLFS